MSASTNGNNDKDDAVINAKDELTAMVGSVQAKNHFQPLTKTLYDVGVPERRIRAFRQHPADEGVGDIVKGKSPCMINIVELNRRIKTGKVRLL